MIIIDFLKNPFAVPKWIYLARALDFYFKKLPAFSKTT